MIDLILTLIDKLTEWARLDASKREERARLIDSIFDGLESVQRDYIQIFLDLHTKLASGADYEDAVLEFSRARYLLEPVRERLRGRVRMAARNRLSPIEEQLFFAIRAYLGLVPYAIELPPKRTAGDLYDITRYYLWFVGGATHYAQLVTPGRNLFLDHYEFRPEGRDVEEEFADRIQSISGVVERLLRALADEGDRARHAQEYIGRTLTALRSTWKYLCHLRTQVAIRRSTPLE